MGVATAWGVAKICWMKRMILSLARRWRWRIGGVDLRVIAAAGLATSLGRADPVADIVAIHVEAMGGRARIEAIRALRATGEVTAAGKTVRFHLLAARPNRVRLETTGGDRALVQGSDGVGPPWEFEAAATAPAVKTMAEGAARTFAADAEFDDPLVAGEARGYRFDYGGETIIDGKKRLRLTVTRRLTETFTLLLDAATYLIVSRHDLRETATGRRVPVVTAYGDFRPVEGVLLPHHLVVTVDGRVTQETRLQRIEANPAVEEAAFSRP
jgi:hypothetical protein